MNPEFVPFEKLTKTNGMEQFIMRQMVTSMDTIGICGVL